MLLARVRSERRLFEHVGVVVCRGDLAEIGVGRRGKKVRPDANPLAARSHCVLCLCWCAWGIVYTNDLPSRPSKGFQGPSRAFRELPSSLHAQCKALQGRPRTWQDFPRAFHNVARLSEDSHDRPSQSKTPSKTFQGFQRRQKRPRDLPNASHWLPQVSRARADLPTPYKGFHRRPTMPTAAPLAVVREGGAPARQEPGSVDARVLEKWCWPLCVLH